MPLTPDVTLPPGAPSPSRVPGTPLGLPLYTSFMTGAYNPPHGSATQIGSTAALVPGATKPASLISQRFVPIMAQQPEPVKLSSAVLPPTDSWLVNVKFPFTWLGDQAGGWIFCACNNYDPPDIPTFSTFRAADMPSTYPGGSFAGSSYSAGPGGGYPPVGGYPNSTNPPYWQDYTGGIYHPPSRTVWQADAGEGTGPSGTAAFYYNEAMLFGAGWIGPSGMFWWTGLPGLGVGGNPPGDRPYVPTGFDTGMTWLYNPGIMNGGDEYVDMAHPVIGICWASCNASWPSYRPDGTFNYGLDPGTYADPANPKPIIPLGGELTAYNNTTAWVWPLNWIKADEKTFTGFVSWGGEGEVWYRTNAYYATVNLNDVREPGTYSYSRQLPSGGLVTIS